MFGFTIRLSLPTPDGWREVVGLTVKAYGWIFEVET
jgi:hypothetical protein